MVYWYGAMGKGENHDRGVEHICDTKALFTAALGVSGCQDLQ